MSRGTGTRGRKGGKAPEADHERGRLDVARVYAILSQDQEDKEPTTRLPHFRFPDRRIMPAEEEEKSGERSGTGRRATSAEVERAVDARTWKMTHGRLQNVRPGEVLRRGRGGTTLGTVVGNDEEISNTRRTQASARPSPGYCRVKKSTVQAVRKSSDRLSNDTWYRGVWFISSYEPISKPERETRGAGCNTCTLSPRIESYITQEASPLRPSWGQMREHVRVAELVMRV